MVAGGGGAAGGTGARPEARRPSCRRRRGHDPGCRCRDGRRRDHRRHRSWCDGHDGGHGCGGSHGRCCSHGRAGERQAPHADQRRRHDLGDGLDRRLDQREPHRRKGARAAATRGAGAGGGTSPSARDCAKRRQRQRPTERLGDRVLKIRAAVVVDSSRPRGEGGEGCAPLPGTILVSCSRSSGNGPDSSACISRARSWHCPRAAKPLYLPVNQRHSGGALASLPRRHPRLLLLRRLDGGQDRLQVSDRDKDSLRHRARGLASWRAPAWRSAAR